MAVGFVVREVEIEESHFSEGLSGGVPKNNRVVGLSSSR